TGPAQRQGQEPGDRGGGGQPGGAEARTSGPPDRGQGGGAHPLTPMRGAGASAREAALHGRAPARGPASPSPRSARQREDLVGPAADERVTDLGGAEAIEVVVDEVDVVEP